MCGRFALSIKTKDIEKLVPRVKNVQDIKTSYNIAPSHNIAAILNTKPDEISYVRWGLVPYWSKEYPKTASLINARAETIEEKPTFRYPFQKRRCLILASGFYEWKKEKDDKYPYFIKLKSDEIFTFAGLWDQWKDSEGNYLISGAIITTEPNNLMKTIHNRMPVLIPEKNWDLWLDPKSTNIELKTLLRPFPDELMTAYEVSKKVNNPLYNYEDCMSEIKN